MFQTNQIDSLSVVTENNWITQINMLTEVTEMFNHIEFFTMLHDDGDIWTYCKRD